jgi:phenylpyruvate tautomerase PptA (4-oxalocrotonate tautomerase family)
MPFIRTSVPSATTQPQRQAIVQGIHQALVDGIGMPADELFNLVSEHGAVGDTGGATQFFYSPSFNGMARSDGVVVVEITMRRGRSDAMKKAMYAHIAANLGKTGVAPDDVFIFVHENDYSDWSVGQGRFAMALVQQVGNAH